MRKILFLNNSMAMGGIEKMIVDFAASLPPTRFTVAVAVFEGGGCLERDLSSRGIALLDLKKSPGIDFGTARRLAHFCRQEGVDVIHTNNYSTWFYAVLARLWCPKIRIVHTEHSNVPDGLRRRYWMETVMSLFSDHVVAVSEPVAVVMRANTWIAEHKFGVIENGIDEDHFDRARFDRAQIRRGMGFDPDNIVIGTVGRVVPVKDHLSLIRAFAEVVSVLPAARLVIVGNGPLFADLQSEIRRLHLETSVVLAGERSDVAQILAGLDIYVVSSLSEGMSIAVLEAMSMTLPVVATNVGGNPDLVSDGENGILVPVSDVPKMATALKTLVVEPALRDRMGQHSRARVLRQFGRKQMVEAYSALYD